MSKFQRLFLVSVLVFFGLAVWAQNASDFTVVLTGDGSGVIITGYNGTVTDVTIPSHIDGFPVRIIRSMDSGTFRSVIIPDTVTTIEERAFARLERNTTYIGSLPTANMVSITIPDSVTTIGKEAFMGNHNLTSVILPDGIKHIREGCFSRCASLTSVILPSNVVYIGADAFRNTSLSSIDIPDSVTAIGRFAFAGTDFESISIPKNITTIFDGTFSGCKKLKSVVFNENILSIGDGAFSGCTELVSVTIPDSIDLIISPSGDPFRGLKKLNLPTQASLRRLNWSAEIATIQFVYEKQSDWPYYVQVKIPPERKGGFRAGNKFVVPPSIAGTNDGDLITEINGIDTRFISSSEFSDLLSGKGGTPVTFKIKRGNSELSITAVRTTERERAQVKKAEEDRQEAERIAQEAAREREAAERRKAVEAAEVPLVAETQTIMAMAEELSKLRKFNNRQFQQFKNLWRQYGEMSGRIEQAGLRYRDEGTDRIEHPELRYSDRLGGLMKQLYQILLAMTQAFDDKQKTEFYNSL